jgi:hypothetical protein
MSYYTRIDLFDVRLKAEHIERVGRAIVGKVKGTKSFQYMLACLEIDPDGELEWSAYSIGNWGHDEEFVAWLAKYCSGGFVAFWGQEGNGDAWAYEFDGKGGVSPCSARRVAAIKGHLTRRTHQRGDLDA